MSKILLSRYGGIGDCIPVAAAAKVLQKRGHSVTLALRADGSLAQTDLYSNQKWCSLLEYRQVGPWNTRCVKYKHGWRQIESTYKDYDQVIDNMFIVEGNSTCKSDIVRSPTDVWKRSRNSNWFNWYDMQLAWANVDPTSVLDEDKRPTFSLTNKEKDVVKKIRNGWSHVISMSPMASSLARSWYQAQEMMPMIMAKYENPLVVVWSQRENRWIFSSRNGIEDINVDINSSLRKSLVVLSASDLYVGVDSGLSHMAEGLGKKHITIYSTVPGWTRSKYYKHQTVIDPGIEHPEYYTFSLMAGDPLNLKEGEANLTKREKLVQKLFNTKEPMASVLKQLNIDQIGAEMELESLQKKLQSFERIQSKALSSVTPEFVFSKMEELCQ